MQLLTIIYDSGIEDSILQLLEALEVPGWTRIPNLHGRGGRGLKELNPVNPGSSSVLWVALPDEEVERLRAAVRRLQESYRLKPGVTILAQPVKELD